MWSTVASVAVEFLAACAANFPRSLRYAVTVLGEALRCRSAARNNSMARATLRFLELIIPPSPQWSSQSAPVLREDDVCETRPLDDPALRGYKSAWSKCRRGREWFARCANLLHSPPCEWRNCGAACAAMRAAHWLQPPCSSPSAKCAGELGCGRRAR